METTVNQRVKSILNAKGIPQEEFRVNIGLADKGQLSRWITEKESIPAKHLVEILKQYPYINARWLLFGEGEMLGSEVADWIVQDQAQPYLKPCAACEAKDLHIRDLQAQVSRLDSLLYGDHPKTGAAS